MHTFTRYTVPHLKTVPVLDTIKLYKVTTRSLSFPGTKFLSLHYFCILDMPPANPCAPSPCGPNSECRVINNQAVCSCIRGYLGSPPTCRPECIVSTDCPQNEACSNQKCTNPCPGSCGLGASCQVVNHNPICVCPPYQTGDPFVKCYLLPRKYRLLCVYNQRDSKEVLRKFLFFFVHRTLPF